jgi:hypothetical protein
MRSSDNLMPSILSLLSLSFPTQIPSVLFLLITRQNYRKLKRKFKLHRTDQNYQNMKSSEKFYKETVDKALNNHRRKIAK